VILAGGVSGSARIARHLWRFCVALTIATGSFFLGQEQVLPRFMQGSPWLLAPVFGPLILMGFWLVRVRFENRQAADGARADAMRRQPSAAPQRA
jgi:hypothetical protein